MPTLAENPNILAPEEEVPLPFVGRSRAMLEVFELVKKAARTDATILICGETGTGKELVARAIHELGPRSDRPFVALNCGAVGSSLIESELFGHESGSFTGATHRHRGIFERAGSGTLLLDEVTEMPHELQVQLLRVLESRELTRVGGEAPVEVRARVLATTNRDCREAIQDEILRKDLYYRLNVFPIVIPPLRERLDDVEPLALSFLDDLGRRYGPHKELSPAAVERLRSHSWPGNARELRNVIERSFIRSRGRIDEESLVIVSKARPEPTSEVELDGGAVGIGIGVGTSIREARRRFTLATLKHTEGDKRKAAEMLGVSLKTVYNYMKESGSALRPAPPACPTPRKRPA